MISAIFTPPARKRRILVTLQAAWRDWREQDAAVIGYILKVLLACLLAMWLSLRFELEQPRTAMLTVAIVMQARSGMVFAKSFYRLLGTLVGIAVSFVLVAMFAQERVLFLLCMALWIGLCTAGSMVFRNHQSYGFVLAGYTLCIVGLPATLDPGQTFYIGTTRISEILIGLLCATLVSDLVFPQRMWAAMQTTVRRRFGDFSDLLRASAHSPDAGSTARATQLRFVGDIFSLESFRASTVLENDDSRAHRLRLSLLNAEFMEASTSLHALQQLLARQQSGHAAVSEALLELYRPLGATFAIDGRSARSEHEAAQIAGRLKAYRATFSEQLAAARVQLPHGLDATARLDFDTGVELMQRFADELQAYVNTYAALATGPDAPSAAPLAEMPLRMQLHFDPLAVTLAGLRGMLALGVLVALWIFTDWRSGIEAITIGTITSTLFATSPSPHRTIRQFIIGAALGSLLTYVCNFQLLPQAQGFLMLALAVTPAIVLSAWLTTRPATAVVGAGSFVIFLSHVGFNSVYSASPVAYLNEAIADIVSILVASTLYGLIDLSTSGWSRRRIAAALRALVVAACREPLPLRRASLESAARDLVQRSGSAQRIADAHDREVADWLLSTLEIGHALIELREQAAAVEHAAIRQALQSSLEHVAELYAAPSTHHREAAIAATTAAMAQLDEPASHAALGHSLQHRLRTSLHFVRSVLLDRESALDAVAPLPIAKEA